MNFVSNYAYPAGEYVSSRTRETPLWESLINIPLNRARGVGTTVTIRKPSIPSSIARCESIRAIEEKLRSIGAEARAIARRGWGRYSNFVAVNNMAAAGGAGSRSHDLYGHEARHARPILVTEDEDDDREDVALVDDQSEKDLTPSMTPLLVAQEGDEDCREIVLH